MGWNGPGRKSGVILLRYLVSGQEMLKANHVILILYQSELKSIYCVVERLSICNIPVVYITVLKRQRPACRLLFQLARKHMWYNYTIYAIPSL